MKKILTIISFAFLVAILNRHVMRENGLVAYWRFDEQSGSNTTDISGNGNNIEMSGNATLISAEWPHGDVAPIITEINPSRAEAGDTITITGEHFGSSQGKSTVKFGEIDAGKAVSWSDTSIQIKTPVIADAVVSVTVTVDGLQSKGVNFVLSSGGYGTFTITLDKGLNMISLPNHPKTPYIAKTFAQKIGDTTVIIRYDNTNQRFAPYIPGFQTVDGFPIEGGQGYIINVLKKKQVSFTGAVWDNTTAAPEYGVRRTYS